MMSHDLLVQMANFTRHLHGVGEHNTKRYGPFGFNPENVASIWQIKWNWIRSMKFETVRIYFLMDLRFVDIQKFCYHGNVT